MNDIKRLDPIWYIRTLYLATRSSSSFGCGAGDHKFPPATAVMGHG